MNARTPHPDYELLERCGQGGMGVVYRARDRRLNRIVALKFLNSGEDDSASASALQRFQREAEAIAALNDPGIATIYEAGKWDGSPFLALEFLSGGTLHDRLPARFTLAEILDYSVQLGSALAFAHSKGVLHRDIKPANCMFSGSGVLKLVDFGLAKPVGSDDITQMCIRDRAMDWTGLYHGRQAGVRPTEDDRLRVFPAIDHCHRDAAIRQRLHENILIVGVLHALSLLPERVLVHRDRFFIHEDLADFRLHGIQIVARHQRRRHDCPQAEMRAVLRRRHAAVAHFQHVGIVPMAWAREFGEVGIHVHNGDRTGAVFLALAFPLIQNVGGGAPQISDTRCPCPRLGLSLIHI